MLVALPFVLLVLAATPGFLSLRWQSAGARRVLGLLLVPSLLLLPWLAPSVPIVRFMVGMGVILASARTLETLLGHVPARARNGLGAYVHYFLSVGEVSYCTSAQDSARARRAGGVRVLRGLLKAICVVALFALATAYPQLHAYWVLHALWCLYAAYLAASGAADLHTGLIVCLSGHDASEVFDCPPLATSPRDFWSRRWNAMFRNSAHRLVFTPLGGAARPVRAVLGVFLVSAVVHEYLVFAALGQSHGHMFAFFMLHGVATLLTGVRRTPWPIPRGVDVVLHSAWLVVTAPLFFAPMEQIFPIQQWHLW